MGYPPVIQFMSCRIASMDEEKAVFLSEEIKKITSVFSDNEKKSESEVKFTVSKKLFTRCPELLNDNSKLQMLFLEFIKEYIERQAS